MNAHNASWFFAPPPSLYLALIIGLGGCTSTPVKEQQSKGNLADIYVNLGSGYMQEGNYQTALTKLEKALTLDPNNPRAHDVLGVVYGRLGDKTAAEQHFKEALALAPDDSKTLNNYGQFLCQLGRSAEAEQMFAKAIQDPLYDVPEIVHTNAGLCAARNNDLVSAERHLRKALEINPRMPVALLEMARVNYQLKKYLPARGYLERYAEVAQHTPQSLELGIQIERALGDSGAVATYSQMLKSRFPDSSEADQIIRLER